jgi:phospholipase D-like protein
MLVGAEGFVFFVLFLFWIWALFDCISTDAALCRNLPKGIWLILVIILPDIGALAWLLLGRPERASWRPGSSDYSSRPARPVPIEDHPRYSVSPGVSDRRSAELDQQLAEWEREQAEKRALGAGPNAGGELDEREAELARREAELRQRELELRERELERREQELGDS